VEKSGLYRRGIIDAGVISLTGHFQEQVDTFKVNIRAWIKGNDIMVSTENVPKAFAEIKDALKTGQISQKEIENRCRKMLAGKLWLGLDHPKQIELKDLDRDLNTPDAKVLNLKLIRASLTVLRNEEQVIPVKDLENKRIATLAMGTGKLTAYQKMLANYTKVDHFFWDPDDPEADNVFNKLKSYDLIIAGITSLDQRYENFGIDGRLADAVNQLTGMKNVILSVFGNPFSLDKLSGIENSKGLIIAYQNNKIAREQAAQLVFGAVGASGTLPVRVNEFFKPGEGIPVKSIARLAYTLPEEEDMNSCFLEHTIDSIAKSSIDLKIFPGCEVLVARHGAVVFNKTYGYHTYEKRTPVAKDDLFDFASVTKATGPLPAIMQLVDAGKIDLDAKFSTYWPSFRHSNKEDMTVREVLAHQAGLKAWIPYWKNTVKKNGKFKFHTFKPDSSAKYNVPVDDHLWLYKNYRKKMYKAIKKTPVSTEKKYLYSGLSFYLYPQIIANLTGEDYETYLKKNIYRPLGAYDLTFNPYRDYPLEQIPPTENDTFFRKKQIHGYVHDEGAAMMGGVSGNAGLFATANDLAKLLQMYLQMGYYGGRRIIEKSTLEEFSKCQYPDNNNRRGLGFDKPVLDNASRSTDAAYPAKSASPSSFGHSGYTGTFVWVDPEKDIIYVFFSNRVYPTRENNKISKMNIRSKVLEAIYNSIIE
jgi:CubicO group peptidase (beta-lactamase class C family)